MWLFTASAEVPRMPGRGSASSASLLALHLMLAGSLLACAALTKGATLGVLAEVCHQIIDATRHTAAAQSQLEWLWRRAADAKGDLLAFGPARMSLLVRLGALVCAIGWAVCIFLEALTMLLLPGHGQHHERSEHPQAGATPVPWAAAATSATIAAAASRGGKRPSTWPLVRVLTLLVATALESILASSGGGGLEATMSATPPLLQFALAGVLLSPDASAGLVLTALAVTRGCVEAAVPARLLLQASPRELIPDLARRLARARATPGVLDVRDVQLWALDESTALGSLVAVVSAHADARAAQRLVRRAFEGAPLASLTVAVERDSEHRVVLCGEADV